MADIYVRKRGKKWEYRFEAAKVGEKRRQITQSGFATKKEALQAGTDALASYNAAGVLIKQTDVSVSDYLDHWMKSYCSVALKDSTKYNYEKNIRLRIAPAIGKYRMANVPTSAIQQLINDLFNKGYSRNTISTVKRILSGAFRYAIEVDEIMTRNPVMNVKIPSIRANPDVPTRTNPNVFIPKEKIDEIFSRFPEGTSTFIPMQIGYRCGLRLGEAFGLLWDDIDLEHHQIHVRRQIQWDNKAGQWYFTNPKYESCRDIEFDDELLGILKREKDRQERARQFYAGEYTYLFESAQRVLNMNGDGVKIFPLTVRENGEYISPRTMQHTSGIIHHSLGFADFTFHSLRHTHATMLIESGAPIKYVQTRLGHKNAEITLRIYSHITPKQRSDGYDLLQKLFN